MVRLERFERPTYGFVVRCSIQLSYKRIELKSKKKFNNKLPCILQDKFQPFPKIESALALTAKMLYSSPHLMIYGTFNNKQINIKEDIYNGKP